MTQKNITCPFCGLVCDDLIITHHSDQLKIQSGECSRSQSGFNHANQIFKTSPQLRGNNITQAKAIEQAASLLAYARSPLIGGLATDVNGMRSAMALADACGAAIDHQDSQADFRNIRVLQDSGWMTTTLTEVRNRADLIVVIGPAVLNDYPRFFERIIQPKPQFRKKPRQLILLGPWDKRKLPTELKGANTTIIKTELQSVVEIAGALRAILGKRPLDQSYYGGVNLQVLTDLAGRLQDSQYSVFTWSASELDHPHAELAIEQIVDLINELNHTTRAAGLPLGGSNSSTTANQVCTWQSGLPLRSSFATAQPRHDAFLFDQQRLLDSKETDLLIWISSLRPEQTPPDTDSPTIVIGHPAMQFKTFPEIFFPVGIPGIDHSGHMFRMDGAVSLPLYQLRASNLPTTAEILTLLTARISSC